MHWFWFSLTIGLCVLELATLQFICVWIALSAFITSLITLAFENLGAPWQVAIFFILSAALFFSTRPLVKKIKRAMKEGNLKKSEENKEK